MTTCKNFLCTYLCVIKITLENSFDKGNVNFPLSLFGVNTYYVGPDHDTNQRSRDFRYFRPPYITYYINGYMNTP